MTLDMPTGEHSLTTRHRDSAVSKFFRRLGEDGEQLLHCCA